MAEKNRNVSSVDQRFSGLIWFLCFESSPSHNQGIGRVAFSCGGCRDNRSLLTFSNGTEVPICLLRMIASWELLPAFKDPPHFLAHSSYPPSSKPAAVAQSLLHHIISLTCASASLSPLVHPRHFVESTNNPRCFPSLKVGNTNFICKIPFDT